MIAPSCPEHERLVLDLALGRLDDGSAVEAEDTAAKPSKPGSGSIGGPASQH